MPKNGMLIPQGATVGDPIPEGANIGSERMVNVMDKKTRIGSLVPESQVYNSIQQGKVPDPPDIPTLWDQIRSSMGNDISQIPAGIHTALQAVGGNSDAAGRILQGTASNIDSVGQSASQGDRTGVLLKSASIPNPFAQAVPQIYDAGIAGNPGQSIGTGLSQLGQNAALLGMPKAMNAGGDLLDQRAAARQFTPDQLPPKLQDTLYKVASPNPKDLNFKADMLKQLPNSFNLFFEKNGSFPKTPQEASQAFAMQQEANRSTYQGMLDQIKDDPSSPAGNLDKRLRQINDTLYPKLQSGGAGSQQAAAQIGAEQAAGLASEAANVRSQLYGYLGKRFNMDPAEVQQIRENMGEGRSLSEQFQRSDQERLLGQGDRQLSSDGIAIPSKSMALDTAWRKIQQKLGMGTPAEQAMRSVVQNMKPGQVIELNPQATPKPDLGPRLPFKDMPQVPQSLDAFKAMSRAAKRFGASGE